MPVKNRGIYTSKDCIEIWANSCSQQPSPRNYIYSIETILHKDYKKLSCTEFSDKYAWDADAYEIACKKGTKRDETVDFVVGLENGQLLMVEAKLDVENVTNLKGEVERKISHTKSILVTSLHFKSCATPSTSEDTEICETTRPTLSPCPFRIFTSDILLINKTPNYSNNASIPQMTYLCYRCTAELITNSTEICKNRGKKSPF